jgi:hypothetical protein
MKVIQNKTIVSESIYYTRLWVTPLQSKTIKVFSDYINFPVNFNVGSFGGTKSIQTSTSFHVA